MSNNRNLIRAQNIADIKKTIFKDGTAVATELGAKKNISTVTVHSILKELLKENSITEGEMVQKDIGRPALEYNFNYDYQLSLHLSLIHLDKIVGEVVNLAGEVKDQVTIHLVEQTQAEIALYFKEIYMKFPHVDNIGIMIPGKIHNGVILSGFDRIVGWQLEDAIREFTDKPLFIQNDAHLMTIGYCIANHIPKSEMTIGIYYPINSHPGITIYTNGELIEGRNALAGEAKYFPGIMYKETPKVYDEMAEYLMKFLPFYNVALAPHRFIFASDYDFDVKDFVTNFVDQTLKEQANHPTFDYIQNFLSMSRIGLQGLIYNNTPYEL